MNKYLIRRMAIAVLLICIFINIIFILRNPSLSGYMTLGINAFALAMPTYTELVEYANNRDLRRVIRKAVKSTPDIIAKGIPETEATQLAMLIYLSNTPEDADFLMSALLAEDRENLLDSIMQSIHFQHPIPYRKTNLDELASQMSIEPADLSCIYNAHS